VLQGKEDSNTVTKRLNHDDLQNVFIPLVSVNINFKHQPINCSEVVSECQKSFVDVT
jgi:hypothetical protein